MCRLGAHFGIVCNRKTYVNNPTDGEIVNIAKAATAATAVFVIFIFALQAPSSYPAKDRRVAGSCNSSGTPWPISDPLFPHFSRRFDLTNGRPQMQHRGLQQACE